jgi:hypothetical protein
VVSVSDGLLSGVRLGNQIRSVVLVQNDDSGKELLGAVPRRGRRDYAEVTGEEVILR